MTDKTRRYLQLLNQRQPHRRGSKKYLFQDHKKPVKVILRMPWQRASGGVTQ